ncbi:MAG: succinyl-diaminopimelate desuccinylase [Rickettsiales bacterium]|jgi:succinyl-diaminopimelate desuccinylase|nr:succinyl-diaminopimelate desuccinylase [Rickettsiales bacterium]
MSSELISTTQELMRCKSVTPLDNGAIDYLISILEPMGFTCHKMVMSEENYDDIINLYARIGDSGKNFAFAGHTDVVPAGDGWTSDPFAAEIRDGVLYGRGAVDMKAAITCFIDSLKDYLADNKLNNSFSLIITGDEEAIAVNGTPKIIKWLEERGEQVDFCIVGEPTSNRKIGDMIKIGRRGSINFDITIHGTQGHVAYPDKASNPITTLVKILNLLIDYEFDEGNENFSATNLEIISVDVGNNVTNLIPADASAKFNIRFNDEYASQDIIKLIEYTLEKCSGKYTMNYRVSGESFLSKKSSYARMVDDAIVEVTGIKTEFSTSGGTSDARFLKAISPICELGLRNKTAHKVDESVPIEDLQTLQKIYTSIIRKLDN